MPELPDITLYVEALQERIAGSRLLEVAPRGPFIVRTAMPPLTQSHGKVVQRVSRVGKRIAISLDGDLHLLIHLMILGRLHWKPAPFGRLSLGDEPAPAESGSLLDAASAAARPRKRLAAGAAKPPPNTAASFHFESGVLFLTESGTRKRAAIHLLWGKRSLEHMNRGGVELLECTADDFFQALTSENHTLKRSLTDPRLVSGIGNAYSDEILHRACISPLKQTGRLSREESDRVFDAARSVMEEWIHRLREEAAGEFPARVTAFRPEMAVHGRYNQPCPVCGDPVQRIVYAENECNYCATCQTDGRLLADRALSRLLKSDWPRTLEELEERRTVLSQDQAAPTAPASAPTEPPVE